MICSDGSTFIRITRDGFLIRPEAELLANFFLEAGSVKSGCRPPIGFTKNKAVRLLSGNSILLTASFRTRQHHQSPEQDCDIGPTESRCKANGDPQSVFIRPADEISLCNAPALEI